MTNNHTIPLGRSLTLGKTWSERIEKIKTHICECGDKLRGNEIQCVKCKDESRLIVSGKGG